MTARKKIFMIALSVLFVKQGSRKFYIENNPEYMRAKIMVMVMELRKKWKGKVFMSFMQL